MAGQSVPVIMCGGAGTRLWPVSRESMPKQFVPLVGHESPSKQVLARITDPGLFARPIVITKADFRFVVAEQLREHGIEADIVLEPMRAIPPAVTVAACSRPSATAMPWCWCSSRSRHSQARTIPRRRRSAASAAAEGRIVTFGIEPTAPVTSYGYIHPGKTLNGASVHAVEAFVEKPDAAGRRDLRRRWLSLEQRQFPVSCRDDAERDRALRAGYGGGRKSRGRGADLRSRFHAARRGALCARADEVD